MSARAPSTASAVSLVSVASAIAASACNFASSEFSVELVSPLLVLLENKGGLETGEVVEAELMPV